LDSAAAEFIPGADAACDPEGADGVPRWSDPPFVADRARNDERAPRVLGRPPQGKGTCMIPLRWTRLALFGAMMLSADLAEAKQRTILATGRRDPRIYAIDLDQALRPENDNTPHAIVSRSLVNPRRLDGTPLGDPANLVLSEDQRTAFVMNNHGAVVNAEFLQHGGRASVSVMDVNKMRSRKLDDTDA